MAAPTLFVGLGGTGSKIVAKLEEQNRDKYDNIGYVVMDTDANEIKSLKNNGYTGSSIQTSVNMTVGEYLAVDKKAEEEWFPVNKILNRKTMTEGAGQVRAISRLAFNAMVRAGGMEALHSEIEKLYRLNSDTTKQSLRIVIVSSLAGGTGSGIMLSTALYIRNYIISAYQQYSAIIRGFFIMPEVFDRVNNSPDERASLVANTYAALRELDAFLRKGDGSIEPRYSDKVRFEVPVAGTDLYQNLDVMPYDFCFLFDKRSCDNSILNSFEDYMDQAVASLQALAVSITSKRNNSSEDNIVKDLCRSQEAGKCNRYAGMGTASLVYPYEDIRDYISIGWAKDVLGKDWLEIDDAFKREKEAEKEKRKTVLILEELKRSKHFCDFVENTSQNAVVNCIKSCCGVLDEGVGKWYEYIDGIEEYIKNDVLKRQDDIENERDICLSALDNLKSSVKSVTRSNAGDIVLRFEDYKRDAFLEAKKKSSAISYDLFFSAPSMSKRNEYNLEYWVASDEKHGFHPLAIRYFLYKTIEEMDVKITDYKKQLSDIEEYFSPEGDFYNNAFDDPTTKKKEETLDESVRGLKDNVGVLGKKKAKIMADIIEDGFRDAVQKIEKYRVMAMTEKVLEEGKIYLEQLSVHYEKFFDNFETSLNSLDDNRDSILSKYSDSQGKTKRYVCATEKCLKNLSHTASNFNSVIEVPGELCDGIFMELRKFALDTRLKSEDDTIDTKYYGKVFDRTIMRFWKDSVEKSYGQLLDINVIEALLKEAEYEKGYREQKEKLHYAEKVMDEMEKLSTPFVSKPIGADRRIIYSCAYNRELNNTKGAIKDFVNKYLKDKGGEVDAPEVEKCSISRYQVDFTQAIYGLTLTDFGKFLPVKESPTYPDGRQAGAYFTAYYDLVSKIHPDSQHSSRINPHLNRNWHCITELPELDADEQKNIEKKICKALIYGLIMNKFKYEQRTVYVEKYKYVLTFKENGNTEDLVSNDDMCDTFDELLIALIKNAMVVDDILNLCEEEIKETVNSMKNLDDSVFFKCLSMLSIDEIDKMYPEAERKKNIRSIFEIALIYSRMAPIADYDSVMADTLIDAALDILKENVKKYVKADDVPYILAKEIEKQVILYRKNLAELEKIWIGIDKEKIASHIKLTVADYVKKLGAREMSEWIRGTIADNDYTKLNK